MDDATNVGNDGKSASSLKSKQKTRRGRGKGGSKMMNFSILGNNVNGIHGKLDSLISASKIFNSPSIITIQETKISNLKTKIPGYKVFSKVRDSGVGGGGLITAIEENLNAIEVSECLEDILVVEVSVNEQNFRVINFYGPQEPQNDQERNLVKTFWFEVEKQIIAAKATNCKLILQGDANAKLGKEIFPRDPHFQSYNGSLLYDLVCRQDLFILNLESRCEGLITRHRSTINGTELAVLDYILVCEELMMYFDHMIIDDKRQHVLTKYSTKKGLQTKITSDHNLLYARFNLMYRRTPVVVKREVFKFKDPEGQIKFHDITEHTNHLSSSFHDSSVNFEDQSKKFLKQLNSTFHRCFSKVRITNKTQNRKDDIQMLFDKKSKIVQFLEGAKSQFMIDWFTEQKLLIENNLATLISTKHAGAIKEQINSLNTLDGQFCRQGLWKVKSKLYPTVTEPPLAKKDIDGNLVTAVLPLKELYLSTYVQRLSDRPMKDNMAELRELKTTLWEGRLGLIKDKKSKDWTMTDLEKVLKSLKNNQTRDPDELLNEIFKPPVIGKDLKLAILCLMNGIKASMTIPRFLQVANISTIRKNKGSKFEMDSERGIFILSVFRKIFDKLIFNDKYNFIEESMSDSNIGARKSQSIKNHLFVLYGIIKYVLDEEKSCIDICIYDIKKCFDALWLEDVMNDLYDSVPTEEQDDKLALIFESNRNNFVAVKTAVGLTKRVNIEKIVTQGGTFGPIECSNTMDKVGQKSFITEANNLFIYKKMVKIPPLGFVDDILTVAKCGTQSLSLNTFINTQIETKKLEFHTPDITGKSKCHSIHVGKTSKICPKLKVHGTEIGQSDAETYLGDIISSDGKHCRNIHARSNKGLGITSQILSMLDKITVGEHYFQSAVLLRESLFLNGILTNAEIWYGIKSTDLKPLMDLDRFLIRKILNTPISTPVESLYLELGLLDIETILKARRINYFFYLLHKKPSDMLYRFFIAQWKYPAKQDWAELVKQDLEDFGLSTNLDLIKSKSEYSFKKLVMKKAKQYAFEKFLKMKASHSKLKDLHYEDLQMQHYLKSKDLTVEEARTIFWFRTRMAQFRDNFRNNSDCNLCPLCKNHIDSQNLAFKCPVILENIEIFGRLEDIFDKNISKKLAETLISILNLRQTFQNAL